jgi:predicted Rossmann-fold nucleotide-binding protein
MIMGSVQRTVTAPLRMQVPAQPGALQPVNNQPSRPVEHDVLQLTFAGRKSKKEQELEKFLKLAKDLDKANAFSATSVSNRIYQEMFPRERGIIVYGSSRTKPGTPQYEYAKAVGQALGNLQIHGKQAHVVTGGGPGAMRAVAEGARGVNAHAVGSAMNFIGEEPSNDVHPEFVIHPNFSERIYAPGGYEDRGAYTCAVPGGPGTEQEIWKKANELFYDQTLPQYPSQKQIVLFDFDNYFSAPRGFLDHVKYLVEKGMANPKMLDMFKLAKTPEEGALMLMDESVPWTPGERKLLEESN